MLKIITAGYVDQFLINTRLCPRNSRFSWIQSLHFNAGGGLWWRNKCGAAFWYTCEAPLWSFLARV